MRLIIKEYLALLKESNELDILLPNLLLSMGIEPISFAQVGVRQYGVDVAAVGSMENKEKTLLLFTIKQGDIGRNDWDSTEQSVRQSLNEIHDVYLVSHIRPEHTNLKKKIILCTGGILKQEVEGNWNGYIKSNSQKGKLEYEFWGGDTLSILIQKYMFSEQILPPEFRSYFRRTLSLIGDVDYDLMDYTLILKKYLLEKDFGNIKSVSTQKQIKKSLRTIHLCLNIIWSWSKQEDNIKNSIIAAERTVLFSWQFISNNNLISNNGIVEIFYSIKNTLFKIYFEYIIKIHKHCCVEDGLISFHNNHILESLNVFEQLGIISIPGIEYTLKIDNGDNANLYENAEFLRNLVKSLINTHQATKSPLYDSHVIEISEAIFLLSLHQEQEFIENWICEIVRNIRFAYKNMGRYFPVSSDSFDDLLTLNVIRSKNKLDFVTMSTLLPILAQWSAVLNLSKAYDFINEVITNVFSQTALQIWYPDSDTEKHIYSSNAAYHSGAVDAPIKIPETIDQMKEMILKVQKNTIKINDLSIFGNGLFILPIISSRHFRTPFLPQFIQFPIIKEKENNSQKST